MTTIKWNDKEYKMPFDADYARQKADTFKEEIIVTSKSAKVLIAITISSNTSSYISFVSFWPSLPVSSIVHMATRTLT